MLKEWQPELSLPVCESPPIPFSTRGTLGELVSNVVVYYCFKYKVTFLLLYDVCKLLCSVRDFM